MWTVQAAQRKLLQKYGYERLPHLDAWGDTKHKGFISEQTLYSLKSTNQLRKLILLDRQFKKF
jgi:hypothetical protein